jgi:ADP-heptose:LPS heptosyltransferase
VIKSVTPATEESTVETHGPGLAALPPARVPGPGYERSERSDRWPSRLSPRLFRRLIERSTPAAEPMDPRNSPLAKWARTTADGPGAPQTSSKLFRPGAIQALPRSVLVLRTDEVGDLAMTLPLLTALRAAWPQARITLVMRGSRGDVMRGSSLVDEVITWPAARPWRGSLLGQLRCWRFARRLLRQARPLRGRFDLAVLPRRDAEHFGARYVACAAALRVVGFDPVNRLGPMNEMDERELITDLVGSGDPRAHTLRHSERMATAMGVTITPDAYDAPGLALIAPADHESARSLLSPLVGTSGPLIAVGLGASEDSGSPASYAAAINAVYARLPVRVVLIGEASDQALADEFVRALTPTIPLASAIGRTHVRAALALLVGSDLFLGGFGDPMHLASSVATPCVAVSRRRPDAEAPWSAGSRVVAPDEVARAVLEVLTGALNGALADT